MTSNCKLLQRGHEPDACFSCKAFMISSCLDLSTHGSLILKPVSNIVDNPLILHTIVQNVRDCKARVWANGASGAHCPQNSQIWKALYFQYLPAVLETVKKMSEP
jgi:hypothetical protein